MAGKVAVLPPSRRSIMAKVKSLEQQHEENMENRMPPVPAPKPFKEPLVPNNRYSAVMATEDDAPSNLQEAMASRVPVLPTSRSSIKAKVKSLEQQQENHALSPPVPPAKPMKEPLMPNLNLNNHNSTDEHYYETPLVPPAKHFKEPLIPDLNHNSTVTATEEEYDRGRASNHAPLKYQHSLDSASSSYPSKQSVIRRPTTIRVNSGTSRSLSLDIPPPLPTQMPVGSLLPPETLNKGQEWNLTP
ncbi:hypothetical protein CRUP_026577, partial [Coryphaenoides rupestris]